MVTDREAGSEFGKDRQSLRSMHSHDLRGRGARHHPSLLFGLPSERGGKIGNEPLVGGGDDRHGRLFRAEQLPVGVQISFAGVCSRHEIRMRIGRENLEDLDLTAFPVRVGFVAGQALKRLAEGRDVTLSCVEKPEHVIERAVLQHDHDEVVHRRQQRPRHRLSPTSGNRDQILLGHNGSSARNITVNAVAVANRLSRKFQIRLKP